MTEVARAIFISLGTFCFFGVSQEIYLFYVSLFEENLHAVTVASIFAAFICSAFYYIAATAPEMDNQDVDDNYGPPPAAKKTDKKGIPYHG